METGAFREITPLQENDFMYVTDRRKKEFDDIYVTIIYYDYNYYDYNK